MFNGLLLILLIAIATESFISHSFSCFCPVFLWRCYLRNLRMTKMLSAVSFPLHFDINPTYSPIWLWCLCFPLYQTAGMPAMYNQWYICYSCIFIPQLVYKFSKSLERINTFMGSKSHKRERKSNYGTVNLSIQEKGEACSISLCCLCCPT